MAAKKRLCFTVLLALVILSPLAQADEHWALSLKPSDVQAASNASSDGDTVVLPAGNYVGFNTTVTFKNGVSLRGQGKGSTVIRAATDYYGVLFNWNTAHRDASSTVEIKDLSLYGPGYDESTYGGAIILYNADHMEDFKIHDLHIEGFNSEGIRLFKATRGLIFNCTFKNIYDPNLYYGAGISILGDELWDDPKPPLGTADAIFIEDCVFVNCKHGVSTGDGSHHVVRYCSFSQPVSSRGMSDVHGHYPPPDAGGNTWEIYQCEFIGSDANAVDVGVQFRGGSGVCWSNSFSGNIARWSILSLDEHGSYPDPYMVKDAYFWDNTSSGQALTDVAYVSYPSYCQKGREYFFYKKPGYTPYPYPHPLRATGSPLTVAISASPLSGQAPLTVSFASTPAGGAPPYTYAWSFGDGQSSSLRSPAHTYLSVGRYFASLAVSDNGGGTVSKTVEINVTSSTSALAVQVSASPDSGRPPLLVAFSGSVSGGIAPYTYSWDFGDGSSSTSVNTSHTYATVGSYLATLTVTDAQSNAASSSVAVQVTSAAAFSLSLSSRTGAPSPGQGGTTDPAPGTYSFSSGESVPLKSVIETNYRFSLWNGDIIESSLFDSQTTIMMDRDRTLSATFCTRCADVNGDLQITPADAQAAFDIFLGKIAEPTWCERENADVNLSGTKLEPKVTPADAQTIFKKYLKKGVVDSDCSGNSRKVVAAAETLNAPGPRLTVDRIAFERGREIAVPIILEADSDITVFGFDLNYPAEAMEFIALERTEITSGFSQLSAHVLRKVEPGAQSLHVRLPDQDSGQAGPERESSSAVRVGGYKLEATTEPASGVLVTLIFRVTGEIENEMPFAITAVFDDLQNASITSAAGSPRQGIDFEQRPQRPDKKVVFKRPDR